MCDRENKVDLFERWYFLHVANSSNIDDIFNYFMSTAMCITRLNFCFKKKEIREKAVFFLYPSHNVF